MDEVCAIKTPPRRGKKREATEDGTENRARTDIVIRIVRIEVVDVDLAIVGIPVRVRGVAVFVQNSSVCTGAPLLDLLNLIWKECLH